MLVRPVERADYDQWLPLWDGYNAFYGRAGDTALDPAVTAMTWSRFFDPYEPVHGLVAEADGRLLGLTHYLYHRSTTAIAPICYLQDLFTSEEARGKGVGRQLMAAALEWAPTAGIKRIELYVYERNAPAIKLYKEFGFAVEGTRKQFIREGDAYLDDHVMARLL